MRLTIVPDDSAVYVDGETRPTALDLSGVGIPADVHALQWYTTRGWIEYKEVDPFTPKPANQDITELPSWANAAKAVFDAWTPPLPPEPAPESQQPTTIGTQTL